MKSRKFTDKKHRERYKDSDGRWKTASLRYEPSYSLPRYLTTKEWLAILDERPTRPNGRFGAYERWLEDRERKRNGTTND